jgi:hypothetical protein
MARRDRDRRTFAETVAEVRATPRREPRVSPGRHGDYWGDLDGYRYKLVRYGLAPEDAQRMAGQGALVVYDACGCGGTECKLDWLTEAEVRQIAESGPPDLHPSKHGRADLEHWRSAEGRDLVVAAVEVSWGSRISG